MAAPVSARPIGSCTSEAWVHLRVVSADCARSRNRLAGEVIKYRVPSFRLREVL